ncbi:MAG: hypothetical protein M1816_004292 [Peltula sp. TS41687]|nr:MAG: hypothetical protein M1816_004292 [Peltula sp. TS41687]
MERKEARYQPLAMFGCLAYRWNTKPNKSKLELSSVRGIFVGYTETSREYRIYDPHRNLVIRTSTVRFVESKKGWATIMDSRSGNEVATNENEESDEDFVDLTPHDGASSATSQQSIPTVGDEITRPIEAVDRPTAVGEQEEAAVQSQGNVEEIKRSVPTSSVGASGTNNERGGNGRTIENVAARRSGRTRKAPTKYGDFAIKAAEFKDDIPIPASYSEAVNGKKYGK